MKVLIEEKNIKQVISDFDGIKAAIENCGVDVPQGTDTKDYAGKIYDVQHRASSIARGEGYNEGYGIGYTEGETAGYNKGYADGQATAERDINPEWTDWRYFCAYSRDSLVKRLKYSDTSNGTNFDNMFRSNTCETIPSLDISKGMSFNSMFCQCTNVKEIFPLNMPTEYTRTNCGSMFQGCSSLVTIHKINLTSNASYVNPFTGCTSLENITIEGEIGNGCGYNFQDSPLLTHDSLMSIINALKTTTASNAKLTLGSTNLSKLTTEDIAIAQNKGWTLS